MFAKFIHAKRALGVALLASCSAFVLPAMASTGSVGQYPERNIEIIVAYPAGGAIDALARLIGSELAKKLGKSVIVVNRAGGSGVIGTNMAAKAKPDGYTLLMSGANAIISPAVDAKVPFVMADFDPVARISETAFVLTVSPDLPVKDVHGLIEYSKQHPQSMNYASTGVGSVQNILSEQFKQRYALNWLHVPYQGGSPALNDVVAERIQLMFANPMLVGPYLEKGRVRAIATSTPERMDVFPDVPTMKEQGLNDLAVLTWVGLLAPAGTPEAIRETLSRNVMEILKDPAISETILKQGSLLSPLPMKEFGVFLEQDIKRWTDIVRESRVALE
ncbi:Bug family tripartite tricarboxylate transporter substrate binding protein [Allopusillimonas ginsengisoli]|uniref:Bug family tripartite tricarboxylate transporter substrate binding protein n=1 Tax=Allopusillimonas ginsengisoli TaxID=453575 RepID=UPI001431115B|nr:tripartite tricarboxylate transporter substrate binding protein [Allopusillimonas ginsengisoli]